MEEGQPIYDAIVNPEDVAEHFWRHNYIVSLSEFGPYLLVNADHIGAALDDAIDYAWEHGWFGLFLDALDIEELKSDALRDDKDEYAYLDEYLTGGNAGYYLSSHNVTIREVKDGIS